MLFNSVEFLVFFPIVVTIYFLIPQKTKWIFLFLASCYFYMQWRKEYIFLIAIPVLIDYLVAMRMGQIEDISKRRKYLFVSLISNLGLLVFFKYLNFFNQSLSIGLSYIGIPYIHEKLDILLPVGISFYTFQSLSYTIDVYRGIIKPEKNLGIFSTFVMFFPQLVAGPIERAKTLLPQFYRQHDFDYDRIVNGARLMLWGLVKKVVIADTIAKIVNEVYKNPSSFMGPSLTLASIFFAFQIYCDFSGYSDIAIGSAKVLGFDLMKNFNRPYMASSIPDFWQRWHISLSTWFRDYLYIPLGGNRASKPRILLNLFTVFVVSGLWHGANWTFVIWGVLHGSYYIVGILTKDLRARIATLLHLTQFVKFNKCLNIITTFILVCLAWIFFRADNIGVATYIISHLHTGWGEFLLASDKLAALGLVTFRFEAIFGLISITLLQIFEYYGAMESPIVRFPVLRWGLYYGMALLILLFGFGSQQFIYFQF